MATNPFCALGLTPHCVNETCEQCSRDVERCFRRLALLHHPDKGGQKERFQEISNAHDLLKCSATRAMYARLVLKPCDRVTHSYHTNKEDISQRQRDTRGASSTNSANSDFGDAARRRARDRNDGARQHEDTSREQRRKEAEQRAHDRAKERQENDNFSASWTRQTKAAKEESKRSGESNAARVHRLRREQEAWKDECRRRRREGEERARIRADLNARSRAQRMDGPCTDAG